MENFQFKDSKYDFDKILIDAGYKKKVYEEQTVFTKDIEVKNEFSDKFTPLRPFTIAASRPNTLDPKVKYEAASPYRFSFAFCVAPMHAIRKIQWDTFPGEVPEILRTMINIVESEAESCSATFMHSSIVLMSKLEKEEGKSA